MSKYSQVPSMQQRSVSTLAQVMAWSRHYLKECWLNNHEFGVEYTTQFPVLIIEREFHMWSQTPHMLQKYGTSNYGDTIKSQSILCRQYSPNFQWGDLKHILACKGILNSSWPNTSYKLLTTAPVSSSYTYKSQIYLCDDKVHVHTGLNEFMFHQDMVFIKSLHWIHYIISSS